MGSPAYTRRRRGMHRKIACGVGTPQFAPGRLHGSTMTKTDELKPLFLLCVNLFIDLFRLLSDNPDFSVTRVCADDFASALKQLERVLEKHRHNRLHALLALLHPCQKRIDELMLEDAKALP
jgi:hypothetical protein